MRSRIVIFALACAFVPQALAQELSNNQTTSNETPAPTIADTARFAITLPQGFSEIHAAEKGDFLFVYSDSQIDPNSKRMLSVTFFEGDKFRGEKEGFMLDVMVLGMSEQHSHFQVANREYLDRSKRELCLKWTGDANGQSFVGVACEIRTPAGFVLIHGLDLASSYSNDEKSFKSSMLSFSLKK